QRTTMVVRRLPRDCASTLLIALLAGCAQAPVVRDHPELTARVTRMEATPPAIDRDEAEKGPSDPSVKPASAEGHQEVDATAAMSVPAGPLTLEQARDLATRYSPILAQSRAAVDAARANVEITDAAFRPTIQGNQAFQAFSSQTGFSGTPI